MRKGKNHESQKLVGKKKSSVTFNPLGFLKSRAYRKGHEVVKGDDIGAYSLFNKEGGNDAYGPNYGTFNS